VWSLPACAGEPRPTCRRLPIPSPSPSLLEEETLCSCPSYGPGLPHTPRAYPILIITRSTFEAKEPLSRCMEGYSNTSWVVVSVPTAPLEPSTSLPRTRHHGGFVLSLHPNDGEPGA
jgi:hypothetical protein